MQVIQQNITVAFTVHSNHLSTLGNLLHMLSSFTIYEHVVTTSNIIILVPWGIFFTCSVLSPYMSMWSLPATTAVPVFEKSSDNDENNRSIVV